MKKLFLLLLVSISIHIQAQQLSEEEAVKAVVNQFFQSLEERDTVLLKQVAEVDGQIWTLAKRRDTLRTSHRPFRDDVQRLKDMPNVTEEPYSFTIHVHKGIAMAWVPYEFRIRGEFSHCGVDVFTLMKKEGSWKIVTVAYTVEKEGCETLKKSAKD